MESTTLDTSNASSKAPAAHVDWERLSFESITVNGHIQCTWSAHTQAWSPPELVAEPHVSLHGLSPALNYGQQIFEGLKAFRTADNETYVFRPHAHAARFAQSARVVAIPPIPEDLFLRAVSLAVQQNEEFVPPFSLPNASLYIRPIAFPSSPVLNLTRATEYKFCVFVVPVAAAQKRRVGGANVLVVEDVDRASPNGTGNVKVGGNYAPMVAVIEKAQQEGYDLTLHLDCNTQTLIDEFAASSFVGARRNNGITTLVIPQSSAILESITVDSLCCIARSWDWKIERRPVLFAELPFLDEVFAVGTAFVLAPVRQITRKSTATQVQYSTDYQSPDCVYRRLLAALRGIQSGREADQWQWMMRVRGSSGVMNVQ